MAAGFGTDATMLQLQRFGVIGTFIRRGGTGLHARLQLEVERGCVSMAGAGQQARRHFTNVGAVDIQRDTLGEVARIGFGETGIGADDAGLRALDACFDTRPGFFAVMGSGTGMSPEQCLEQHGARSVEGGPAKWCNCRAGVAHVLATS